MTEDDIRRNAFAMPFHNPAFPPGPYRFVDREFLIITYRTDPEVLKKSFRRRSNSLNLSLSLNLSKCRIQPGLGIIMNQDKSFL